MGDRPEANCDTVNLWFNTLPIYIQLAWSWKASFIPCFRMSVYRVNKKMKKQTQMRLFSSFYAMKWESSSFYFNRRHWIKISSWQLYFYSLYLTFYKKHVQALEKHVLYSRVHWLIYFLYLWYLGAFYFREQKGFFCLTKLFWLPEYLCAIWPMLPECLN